MDKICRICGAAKGINEFYVSSKAKDGLRAECKKCESNYQFHRRKNRPEVRRRSDLKRVYGISLEEYDAALALQEKKCGCCGLAVENSRPRQFAVDHCHQTGKNRGILCGDCNMAIGLLGDNLKGLENAIQYLNKFTS
jgi:hypothetical protein